MSSSACVSASCSLRNPSMWGRGRAFSSQNREPGMNNQSCRTLSPACGRCTACHELMLMEWEKPDGQVLLETWREGLGSRSLPVHYLVMMSSSAQTHNVLIIWKYLFTSKLRSDEIKKLVQSCGLILWPDVKRRHSRSSQISVFIFLTTFLIISSSRLFWETQHPP